MLPKSLFQVEPKIFEFFSAKFSPKNFGIVVYARIEFDSAGDETDKMQKVRMKEVRKSAIKTSLK